MYYLFDTAPTDRWHECLGASRAAARLVLIVMAIGLV